MRIKERERERGREREGPDTKIHGEDCHVTTEAETGLMHLLAKEHQGLPATTGS